jgi:hypothetical protein
MGDRTNKKITDQNMTLIEKHTALVVELGELKINFQDVAARTGGPTEAQKVLDRLGVELVELERASGIQDARFLIEHEAFVLPQLEQFSKMLESYSKPLELDPAFSTPEEVLRKTSERSQIVFEAEKSVKTLSRMKVDSAARRKKLSAEAMEIALQPDVLTSYERTNFERLALDQRGARATKSVFTEILKPLVAS